MFKFLLFQVSILAYIAAAINVSNIKDCPPLTPRDPPTNVRDLRIDDIKVIGALGDSVTTGYGILGFDTSLSNASALREASQEFRGLSFSSGGDNGAYSIANFIKHYQPNVLGSSIGQRPAEICRSERCHIIKNVPDTDFLNAALSGAIAMNINYELDYLISNMKSLKGIDFQNDWKMINLQIGNNDMCGICNSTYMNQVTPDKYRSYIESSIDKIRANIPKVVVNMITAFDISQIIRLYQDRNDYCYVKLGETEEGCSCGTTDKNLKRMSQVSEAYNRNLLEIYEKYQNIEQDDFALIYQNCNVKTENLLPEAFSTLDCLHPSIVGHQWLSKIIWNQLFISQAQKPELLKFNENETIYCPVDSDRIAIH